MKLFSWNDPQTSYPTDALRVHASDVRSLLVRAAHVDDAAGYRLYDEEGLRRMEQATTALFLQGIFRVRSPRRGARSRSS